MRDDLAQELASGRPFLYDWDLGNGRRAPIAHPDLALAQATVRELFEADVRAALAEPARPSRALDLACNEGWWSHRLIDWGAVEVIGIEARPETVRRARALRDHAGITADQFDVRTGDATLADPGEAGTFDVVLCLGLLYHLEDPIGMLRRARALTRRGGLFVLETQVARSPCTPLRHAWGSSDDPAETSAGAFAVRWERDPGNPLASGGGVVSLIPDRAALLLGLAAAGFADVRVAEPQGHHVSGFRSGDRVVVTAH
jgi:SAM-dependent methyltransferase